MFRLLHRHRLVRPAQPLNIRSSFVQARCNLVQQAMLLLSLFVMLVRSRIRVVTRSRVGRVNGRPVLVLLLYNGGCVGAW